MRSSSSSRRHHHHRVCGGCGCCCTSSSRLLLLLLLLLLFLYLLLFSTTTTINTRRTTTITKIIISCRTILRSTTRGGGGSGSGSGSGVGLGSGLGSGLGTPVAARTAVVVRSSSTLSSLSGGSGYCCYTSSSAGRRRHSCLLPPCARGYSSSGCCCCGGGGRVLLGCGSSGGCCYSSSAGRDRDTAGYTSHSVTTAATTTITRTTRRTSSSSFLFVEGSSSFLFPQYPNRRSRSSSSSSSSGTGSSGSSGSAGGGGGGTSSTSTSGGFFPISNNNDHGSFSCSASSSSSSSSSSEEEEEDSSTTTTTAATRMATTVSSSANDDDTNETIIDNDELELFSNVRERFINTWVQQLSTETSENLVRSMKMEGISQAEQDHHHDTTTTTTRNIINQRKRPIYNGHYISVQPQGIYNPRLILYSEDVAYNLLQLSKEQIDSNIFTQWMSGNIVLQPKKKQNTNTNTAHDDDDDDDDSTTSTTTTKSSSGSNSRSTVSSWATPYGLSIMGQRYTNNCPYNTGDGYGDGRAISIGELKQQQQQDQPTTTTRSTHSNSYELQLKGGGTTPFSRGADGRAVLRSSIREFLASESMHYLRVNTTRALSLVVSDDTTNDNDNAERVYRPWYSNDGISSLRIPSIDDPRLSKYTIPERKEILQQLRVTQKNDPNIMISERVAITCRVARSFMRIGHIDLFARRATTKKNKNNTYDTTSLQWKEYNDIVWHACYREFYHEAYKPYFQKKDIQSAATILLERTAENIAIMTSNWLRVGYIQGNFNGDNCLLSGATMDYGPFGFIEEYSPLSSKWTGSGQHFSFMNQPTAGYANYNVLVDSIIPIIITASADNNNGNDNTTNTNDDGSSSNVEKEEEEEEEIIILKERFMSRAQKLFQQKVYDTYQMKLGFLLRTPPPIDDEDNNKNNNTDNNSINIDNDDKTKNNNVKMDLDTAVKDDDTHDDTDDDLWSTLEPLMRKSRTDYTLLFRQLTYIIRDYPLQTSTTTHDGKVNNNKDDDDEDVNFNEIMSMLDGGGGGGVDNDKTRSNRSKEDDDENPNKNNHKKVKSSSSSSSSSASSAKKNVFYEPLTDDIRQEWITWLKTWRKQLILTLDTTTTNNNTNTNDMIYERMRMNNPKYVLREWMLVNAYTASENENHNAELYNLYNLIQHPYDEGTKQEEMTYYRLASEHQLTTAGTAFMS